MERSISTKEMKSIAYRKGMRFSRNEKLGVHTLSDPDGTLLMEYAPITISMMTEKRWREECNKLKRQD